MITDHTSSKEDLLMLNNILNSAEEENELAIKRRKSLLERVMERLRALIVESQQKGDYGIFKT